MVREGEDKAIRYRGEELSTCENDETLEELSHIFRKMRLRPSLSFPSSCSAVSFPALASAGRCVSKR